MSHVLALTLQAPRGGNPDGLGLPFLPCLDRSEARSTCFATRNAIEGWQLHVHRQGKLDVELFASPVSEAIVVVGMIGRTNRDLHVESSAVLFLFGSLLQHPYTHTMLKNQCGWG